MSKTIVSLNRLSPEQEGLIRRSAPGYNLVQTPAKTPDPAVLRSAEVVLGWSAAAAETLLEPDTPLRWVQTWSAGIDKLPLEQFQARGVLLTNASGVHAEPISSVIFAYMLNFTRDMHLSIRNQVQHRWHSARGEGELHGKSIVICGTGAIGAETARIAKAFRMKTVGVSRSGRPLPDFDEMYRTPQLREAVAQGDFVVNTLPLTDETKHLFDEKMFAAFKPGACYINIGRGDTTDTEALMGALKSGHLRGAGLDVFETEPLPEDHPLWEMEQVIITPHNAGMTDVYTERVLDIFTGNLASYVSEGAPRRNLVDYDRQY